MLKASIIANEIAQFLVDKKLLDSDQAADHAAETAFAIPVQNVEGGKAENPGEADKLLAVSMLMTELRDVAPKDMFSLQGRFWHLLGFSEGVVEAMIREVDAPESFGSWAFYTECRLKHFRSVFVPSSASQP